MRFGRKTIAGFAVAAGLSFAQLSAQDNGSLKLTVEAGDKAANVVSTGSAVSPVVRVVDRSDKPVAGARVSFVLPTDGARATFPGDKNVFSVQTGSDGRAQAAKMSPVGVGRFNIAIQADRKGQIASATISQVNVETASEVDAATSQFVSRAGGGLAIEIIEGDDGVNIIDKETAVKSVVRVVDKNALPGAGVVAGATVTFAIVASRGGSQAEFSDKRKTIAVVTGADGVASASELHPSGKGEFRIDVQVSMNGQTANRTITQTNYPTELAALQAGKMPGSSTGDAAKSESNTAQIKAGGDGKNIVKGNQGTAPEVDLSDANGVPLPGVPVAFLVQASKGIAQFSNGQAYVIVVTDSNGHAAAALIKPLGKGQYSVKAIAAYKGAVTTSSVQEVNYLKPPKQPKPSTGNQPKGPGISKGWVVLGALGTAAGIAGAAASKKASNAAVAVPAPSPSPSCSASSLQNQLQSQLNSLLPLCTVSGSANTMLQNQIASTWTSLCTCTGHTPGSQFGSVLVPLTLIDMCLGPTGFYSPASIAARAAAGSCS